MGRVITGLVLVAVVVLSAYNTVELRRLRAEVTTLRAGQEQARSEALSAREAQARELRKRAEEHLERAGELLSQGNVKAAKREVQKSEELLADAARATGAGDLVTQLRDKAGSRRERAESTAEQWIERARGKGRTARE